MRRSNASLLAVCLFIICMAYFFMNDSFLLTRREMFSQRLRHLFSEDEIESKGNQRYPAPILILTYMRSGSTFLGDVIQSNPDVFYIFEPLWSVEYYPSPLKDLQGNDIRGTFDEIARQILKDVFTCQIFKLPKFLFHNDIFLEVSRATSAFKNCKENFTDISFCADLLQRECLKSRYVMIKSIRLRAYQLLDIKEDFPDLKVIYLIRDPRATLHSQRSFGRLDKMNESVSVSQFCRNVTQDTQAIRIFQKFYRNDVLIVYHDSFQSNQLSFSRELYAKLNLPFTPIAEKRIDKLTGKVSNCTRHFALCTSKFNSTVEIKKWRTEIQYSFVKIIDSLCQEVYRTHGFLPFSSLEVLTNLSIPSHNSSLSTFHI